MNQLLVLTFVDYLVFLADLLAVIGVVLIHFRFSLDPDNCETIIVGPNELKKWRYALYAAVLTAWAGLFFTFTLNSPIRFLFYIALPISIIITLNISLPAWFCKRNKHSFQCNCDYYTYRDFEVVLVLGFLIGLLIIFAPHYYLIFPIGILFLGLIYFFIPKKNVKILNYPPELLINSNEELEEFLMNDSIKKKLIILIHSGCDFCEIQVNEINELPQDVREQIKILDFSNGPVIDNFFLDFLNIQRNYTEMKFPATLVIEGGMSFDRRMGILSANEITVFLQNFNY